jgi:hypothetical protein
VAEIKNGDPTDGQKDIAAATALEADIAAEMTGFGLK